MLVTPNNLIEELALRGYDMTPRRLVDWRQKQLLPPLAQRGRGQGRGWINGWEDARIIEQAIAVQELLWMHERTDWLYVPLWCLGFDVPIARVKTTLLAKLQDRRRLLTNGSKDSDDIANTISALAFSEARRSGPKGDRRLSSDLFEFMLGLMAGGSETPADLISLRDLAIDLDRFRELSPSGADVWGDLDTRWPAILRLVRRWTYRYASIPRLEDAAVNATDAEWQSVHDDWRLIQQLIASIRDAVREEPWELLDEFLYRGTAVLGPWLSLVTLSLRRNGQGESYDAVKDELISFLRAIQRDPALVKAAGSSSHDAGASFPTQERDDGGE